MKRFILLITCLVATFPVLAQEIRGRITDMQKAPVPGASILLVKAGDTVIVKTAVSGPDGRFSISFSRPGDWQLLINMLGYEPYQSKPFTLDTQHINTSLPDLQLRVADARELRTISVTAKKPLIEQQVDRIVVNVDAMISGAASNALEVLSRSPGVMVTGNGAISLNGKEGVLVLINGRSTYLAGNDLANYLKSLPGSTLEKIELMTNPPAKYEASGNAGVINIRMKKSTVKGFNGNLSLGYTQAVYWKSNNAVNFNYRNNKINFFGNLGYSGDRNYVRTDISRRYEKPDGALSSGVQMNIFNKNTSDGVNLRLGLDYLVTEKTTLGIVVNGLTRPNGEKKYTNSRLYDAAEITDSAVAGYLDGRYKWKNGGINLNLQQRFDSTGRELTADLDYIRYSSNGFQQFQNTVYLPGNVFKNQDNLLGRLPGNFDVYSAKADYVHPLKNKARVDFGAKASYVRTDNAAEYFNVSNGTALPDYDKTNRFRYQENINAAYISFRKEFPKWGMQAGLRAENTVAKGRQLGNPTHPDSSFRRKYTDLFPTAYLTYKLDSAGHNTLVLSYGRRIDRPAYNNLNPFLFFSDKFSYRAGNPFLKPQYANNLELSYRYKSIFSATFLYNVTRGEIRETIEQEGNIFISRSSNIGRNTGTGIIINSSLDLTAWWRATLYMQDIYRTYKSTLPDEGNLNTSMNTWGGSLYNEFQFKHGWSAELFAMYIGDNLLAQFTRDPLWQLDVSVRKKILKEKGTVRLGVNDIFHTLKIGGDITNVKQTQVTYLNVFDTRNIAIAFTYKFGKENNAARRNRQTGGADTEQQRVGSNK
ncbi:hypothetical protein J2T02_003529 [Chitinophaga terrae (ex Kim and Jung 2007)]|uniref:TonB-dependent receptor n=1 Tax=Chitinophaga terrae (ex Kim and Jung 2007) TaxID=408074 RepID=UPI00277DDEE3|nr:TonB-dependent receptor [Chitinophaga terrae (ex Kim and Jung 2007)]MDQ0108396.1 hypothetical protein [Chitinophaga terrae (ex Kim and Jung 2007)]